jgi:hypothetical protein
MVHHDMEIQEPTESRWYEWANVIVGNEKLREPWSCLSSGNDEILVAVGRTW